MKVVVFGGSGFLGSHVADALTEKGYDTTIFDVCESRYLQKNQKLIVGSILDEKLVKKAVKDADIVYNFAGIAGLDQAKEKPIETVRNNVLGNTIILEACRKYDIKRFIFASSLYVYSNSGSFYRTSKQACELVIKNFQEEFGLNYTILRYGSLYGPRSDERNYIYKILKQAITKGKIVSTGEGKDLREYIHVSDAAKYSVDILSEEYKNQHVILSGNQPMRRKDLLIMIKEMLGNKIEIEFEPKESDVHYEVTPYSFNPEIAKKYVGRSHLDLGEGVLQQLGEIYKKYNPHEEINGILIQKDDNDEGK